MNFILKDDVHKMFDENEAKLTFYSEECEEKMLVITELTAVYFNKIKYGVEYNLEDCINDFLKENKKIDKQAVKDKFTEVLNSLKQLSLVKLS